jgi:hypothetical protein
LRAGKARNPNEISNDRLPCRISPLIAPCEQWDCPRSENGDNPTYYESKIFRERFQTSLRNTAFLPAAVIGAIRPIGGNRIGTRGVEG